MGVRRSRDPFTSPFDHPTHSLFPSIHDGFSGASSSVSTTTTIVNGQKHTITKIHDQNVSFFFF